MKKPFLNLHFYLDKNQSHGQDDFFLRMFLLKLNLCRPKEDLNPWKLNSELHKSVIVLFHELKNIKIVILDKTDSICIENQMGFADEIIKIYQQSSKVRKQLIFIDLTNDLDLGNVLAYQFIENKRMIEFLQWRPTIEIREWLESCAGDLERENWFGNEINNYIRELKNV